MWPNISSDCTFSVGPRSCREHHCRVLNLIIATLVHFWSCFWFTFCFHFYLPDYCSTLTRLISLTFTIVNDMFTGDTLILESHWLQSLLHSNHCHCFKIPFHPFNRSLHYTVTIHLNHLSLQLKSVEITRIDTTTNLMAVPTVAHSPPIEDTQVVHTMCQAGAECNSEYPFDNPVRVRWKHNICLLNCF